MREVTTDSRFASRCWLVVFENRIKKVIKNVKKTLPGDQSFLCGIAFSVRVACHSRSWLNELRLKCHLSLRPTPSPPPSAHRVKKNDFSLVPRRTWSILSLLDLTLGHWLYNTVLKRIYWLIVGLQNGVIGPLEPYGLPLNITILPQKLKEAGKDKLTSTTLC